MSFFSMINEAPAGLSHRSEDVEATMFLLQPKLTEAREHRDGQSDSRWLLCLSGGTTDATKDKRLELSISSHRVWTDS